MLFVCFNQNVYLGWWWDFTNKNKPAAQPRGNRCLKCKKNTWKRQHSFVCEAKQEAIILSLPQNVSAVCGPDTRNIWQYSLRLRGLFTTVGVHVRKWQDYLRFKVIYVCLRCQFYCNDLRLTACFHQIWLSRQWRKESILLRFEARVGGRLVTSGYHKTVCHLWLPKNRFFLQSLKYVCMDLWLRASRVVNMI